MNGDGVGAMFRARLTTAFGTQAQAARALGVSESRLSDLVRGIDRITPLMAARAARLLNDREFGRAIIVGQNAADLVVARDEYERTFDALERYGT